MRPRSTTTAVLILLALPGASPALRAETPASPPAELLAELPGGLVLCGGGKVPDAARERFLELAGGEKARLVVLVDTDAARERVLEEWKARKVAVLVVAGKGDRPKAVDESLAPKIAESTGVWIENGDTARLAATYVGTAFEREARKLLERGGVIGCASGGAALAGKVAPGGGPGFGWLPGVVVATHLLKGNRVDPLLGTLAKQPGLAGLGVDEDTAVVVKGRTVKVLGESYAAVCLNPSARRPASVQIIKAGGVADLPAMRRAAFYRTQPPFPAEKAATPEVPDGTLMIGGGGGLAPELMRRFIDLAGGPDAPIVVVPTAMEDPIPEEPTEVKLLKRAGAKNVRLLHTRRRSEANSPEFTAILKAAKGVWFTGGRQWRFVDAYQDTLAEKRFHDVLKRGGVIGGSSAGASIQSEYMPRGHPLGNLVMMAEGYERGLGFLPGVAVDQHFFARKRTRDMTELMNAYPQLLGIGIDEGTVIVVRGSVLEVAGKSKVAVYDRRKPVVGEKDYEELLPGERYDMKTRTKLDKK